ncbi:hypothetical protein HY989_05785 [Candidatus Micrarchaeota archaeon]|nr:hypothetical protein [Candidatus Micrarchaeota archaeon]
MPQEFMQLQCDFKEFKLFEKLEGNALNNENVCNLMEKGIEAIRKNLFDFAPIDKKGIEGFAKEDLQKIKTIADLLSLLSQIKPGALETSMAAFCRDDRDPQRIIEKKLAPVTDIAVGYYFSLMFEKIFPIKIKPQGTPPKKEFRFIANYSGWLAVRKVNLEIAENKETLSTMVHTMATIDGKREKFFGTAEFFSKMKAVLSKYPERKSFGKMIPALVEANKEGLFSQKDERLSKYALYKLMMQFGYSPYLSSAMLEGIYPELKIPKPKGRMRKD